MEARRILAGMFLQAFCLCVRADDEEALRPVTSSMEFNNAQQDAKRFIETREFQQLLRAGPSFGSLPGDDDVKRIRRNEAITGVALGDPGATYDVILQPGHYKREPPKKVGTRGARVTEKEFAAYVTALLAQKLKAYNYKVLVISADDYITDNPATEVYDGLAAKVFLSIHADGSDNKCSSGPSLGYASSDTSSMIAMHQLRTAVAIALQYKADNFMRDGFTVNLSRYYMFRSVKASIMEGILEAGELTCPAEEDAMIAGAAPLAANIATALHFIVERGTGIPSK